MRLTMPIGAPGVPGPVNRQLLSAQGSYAITGQAANLTYASSGTFVKPTAANTGDQSGITRTAYTGPYTITTNGTVIQNKNITAGTLGIRAQNVVIKNCYLGIADFNGIDCQQTGNLNTIIQDCEIDGTGSPSNSNAIISYDGTQILRCNIYGWGNGVAIGADNLLVQSCYIHDLPFIGADPHIDGIQNAGANNVTIQGNAIYSWDTSCIIDQPTYSSQANHWFDNNWLLNQNDLDGSGKTTAYPLYIEDKFGNTTRNVRVTNNIISKGHNSSYVSYGDGDGTAVVEWTNNRDYTTGLLIPTKTS